MSNRYIFIDYECLLDFNWFDLIVYKTDKDTNCIYFGVDRGKVRRLGKLCKELDAEVILLNTPFWNNSFCEFSHVIDHPQYYHYTDNILYRNEINGAFAFNYYNVKLSKVKNKKYNTHVNYQVFDVLKTIRHNGIENPEYVVIAQDIKDPSEYIENNIIQPKLYSNGISSGLTGKVYKQIIKYFKERN